MAVKITGIVAQYLNEQISALLQKDGEESRWSDSFESPKLAELDPKKLNEILSVYHLTTDDLLQQQVLCNDYVNEAATSITPETCINLEELQERGRGSSRLGMR